MLMPVCVFPKIIGFDCVAVLRDRSCIGKFVEETFTYHSKLHESVSYSLCMFVLE